jgi:hypothetical protein
VTGLARSLHRPVAPGPLLVPISATFRRDMVVRTKLALLVLALGAAACGARSSISIPEPQGDAGALAADASAEPSQRSCAPDCTIGHECCLGTCDGPAVQLPGDCCSCIAGEISSFDCGGLCGGSP